MSPLDLPVVNATLNGLSAIFLTLGFIFIKRGNKIEAISFPRTA